MLSSNGGDKDVSLGIARIAHEFGMLVLVRIKCLEWLRDHCLVGVAWPLVRNGRELRQVPLGLRSRGTLANAGE